MLKTSNWEASKDVQARETGVAANTKEAILLAAARLFAREGFEATSARAIAKSLGLSQSSLYKHYSSKRAIFDAIVERTRAEDAERARRFAAPEGTLDETPDDYRRVSFATLRRFTEAQFSYWTEDEFAASFRKTATLERFRNAEIAALYRDYFGAGPLGYVADIFWALMKRGAMRQDAPQPLALEFYAPIYALYSLFDAGGDRVEIASALRTSLDRFESRWVLPTVDKGNLSPKKTRKLR